MIQGYKFCHMFKLTQKKKIFLIKAEILNHSSRVEEISSMLGSTGTQGKKSAIEMLELAQKNK